MIVVTWTKAGAVRMERNGNSKDMLEVIRSSQTKCDQEEEIGPFMKAGSTSLGGWHGDAQFRLVHVQIKLRWRYSGVSWYMDCCNGVLWMTQNLPRT